jgi:hypothetical protein
MTAVKGNGFGVRFFRRGIARATAAPKEGVNDMSIKSVEKKKPEAEEKPKEIPVTVSEVSKEKSLWKAAALGDCYKIRLLVMEGVDIEARDEQGRTALNIATQYKRNEAVKTLLAAKEMLRMAKRGDLPESPFYSRFSKNQGES